jgi:uncharacterized membrane protein (UPF0182 family)
MSHVRYLMTFPNTGFRPSGPRFSATPHARRIILGGVAIAVLALGVFPWLATFATDWLWYKEIHYESVFLTSLVARAVVFVLSGGFALAFLYGNVAWARRGPSRLPALFVEGGAGAAGVDVFTLVPKFLLAGSIVVALITAAIASAQWTG